MILKLAFAILVVLVLRLVFPGLVRGLLRILLVMTFAVIVFGAVVWMMAQ